MSNALSEYLHLASINDYDTFVTLFEQNIKNIKEFEPEMRFIHYYLMVVHHIVNFRYDKVFYLYNIFHPLIQQSLNKIQREYPDELKLYQEHIDANVNMFYELKDHPIQALIDIPRLVDTISNDCLACKKKISNKHCLAKCTKCNKTIGHLGCIFKYVKKYGKCLNCK